MGHQGRPEPLSRPNGTQPESPEQRSGYKPLPHATENPTGRDPNAANATYAGAG